MSFTLRLQGCSASHSFFQLAVPMSLLPQMKACYCLVLCCKLRAVVMILPSTISWRAHGAWWVLDLTSTMEEVHRLGPRNGNPFYFTLFVHQTPNIASYQNPVQAFRSLDPRQAHVCFEVNSIAPITIPNSSQLHTSACTAVGGHYLPDLGRKKKWVRCSPWGLYHELTCIALLHPL